MKCHVTQNLVFNPDGYYLASLIIASKTHSLLFNLKQIHIYDSDTLNILHTIQSPNQHVQSSPVQVGVLRYFQQMAVTLQYPQYRNTQLTQQMCMRMCAM